MIRSTVEKVGQPGRAADPVGTDSTANPPESVGTIERSDPRIDAIVPPDAVLEVLADGHKWTEGPLWVPQLRSLLYSDIPNNAIYRWTPGAGASLWLSPAVHSRRR